MTGAGCTSVRPQDLGFQPQLPLLPPPQECGQRAFDGKAAQQALLIDSAPW